jgi:hypothetical protein
VPDCFKALVDALMFNFYYVNQSLDSIYFNCIDLMLRVLLSSVAWVLKSLVNISTSFLYSLAHKKALSVLGLRLLNALRIRFCLDSA